MKLIRNLTPNTDLTIELTDDELYEAYFEVRRMMHERGIFFAFERNQAFINVESEDDINSFRADCVNQMIETEQNTPTSDDDLYDSVVFNLAHEYGYWKET